MNQINAIVHLDPMRLDRPLRPLKAAQLHSFVACFRGIPDDDTSLVVRLFKTDGIAHFDIPLSRRPDGSAICYIIGTCFPDCGNMRYEVHAFDARGNMTALGFGGVDVSPFSTTGDPIQPGASVPLMQIRDRSGALHTIEAVMDDAGEWTSILDA